MIRPLNFKFRTILKIAISLAVVAFVLFLWAGARPVPIQVQVTFICFTNPGTFRSTQAFFCVSNAGRCSVLEQGFRRVEMRNKPDGLLNLYGTGELKPGESKTIWHTPPTESEREAYARLDDWLGLRVRLGTNLEPWRLSLSFYKLDWREKLVRNPPGVLGKVLRFVPAKWLERHPIEVHSDWINGPELMPVATNTANTRRNSQKGSR